MYVTPIANQEENHGGFERERHRGVEHAFCSTWRNRQVSIKHVMPLLECNTGTASHQPIFALCTPPLSTLLLLKHMRQFS